MVEKTGTPGSTRRNRFLGWSILFVIMIAAVAFVLLGSCSQKETIATQTAASTVAISVDWLADSTDACVVCHRINTPGITSQFGASRMAEMGTSCRDCHEVTADYPGAVSHAGTYRTSVPTPAMCQKCHATEVAQYYQSRHSLPAYVAVKGTSGLTAAQMSMYQAIPEGSYAPDKARNAIYALEGEDITRFTCEVCHNIGLPNADGSAGGCQSCHQRHLFSLEQVRKPETCNACHIGPDHPQWEIYHESGHGIAYSTMGYMWNWNAEPGESDVKDLPAATCATCHISSFGQAKGTHDVGERLTWYLFAAVSESRPNAEQNAARMQTVCKECHNPTFISEFYTDADKLVVSVNDWIKESDAIMADLKARGLLTDAPFDEPIDYVYFNIWHHWGRTTKFGAWMQGADYSQWHGAYEILQDMTELKAMAEEKLAGK